MFVGIAIGIVMCVCIAIIFCCFFITRMIRDIRTNTQMSREVDTYRHIGKDQLANVVLCSVAKDICNECKKETNESVENKKEGE